MYDIEFSRKMTMPVKCMIIIMLSLCFVVAFIPLWQMGVNNSVKDGIIKAQSDIEALDQEGRALIASAILPYSQDGRAVMLAKE